MSPSRKTDSVLIVGAGCFGTSTAYHLLKRGFTDVTIIERSDVLPAPDAASTDLNKVVRSSYSDAFYAKLAREAISAWKGAEWGNTYHESGCLVISKREEAVEETYATTAFHNDVALGARATWLKDENALRAVFPPGITLAPLAQFEGYFNGDGGWAHATQGVALMMSNVTTLGGKILPGKAVDVLLRNDSGRTTGVRCTDGTTYIADLVILAMGSWTASALPELELENRFTATGQSVVTIQLSKEEADVYRDCPVILDFRSGFYMFPPNEEDVVKLAIHAAGYTHTFVSPISGRPVSTPRTSVSHAEDGLRIPRANVKVLRDHLREVYPDLAEKAFRTRLCWYTDAPDGDWVIGFYPSDPSLMLATAGCGHAYKFLPVIGRLVADAVEGKLDPELIRKFALDRQYEGIDKSRVGVGNVQELNVEDLVMPEDLLPTRNTPR